MARTALVTYDFPGILGNAADAGTFVLHWARLLREAGEDVTVVATRLECEPMSADQKWRDVYHRLGCEFVELAGRPPSENRWPHLPTLDLSDRVAEAVAGFDVAYFQDWANLALITVRRKRFGTGPAPRCVTVLHGGSEWRCAGNHNWPAEPETLNQQFMERYSAEHSDWTVSPSRFMADWLLDRGWKLREDRLRVLGLPVLAEPRDYRQDYPRRIEHLVYFGALERCKGYRTFVDALEKLALERPDVARLVRKVTFLGPISTEEPDAFASSAERLGRIGYAADHVQNLDIPSAAQYLADHAAGALAVMPSERFGDNFPFTVIEASLSGVRLVCARTGGIPEILGPSVDHLLFDPYPSALADKLAHQLLEPAGQPRYEWEAANRRWLQFHAEVLADSGRVTLKARRPSPSLDVCVTYHNKPRELPQLLDALDRQTASGFQVIAVDDGSPDPEAREVFDCMQAKYSVKGWAFFRQHNAFVDAARNRAARMGRGEYLLFIDADDVIPFHGVERMLDCIVMAGDDCLVPATYSFVSAETPLNASGEISVTAYRYYMPLGPALAAAILAPEVLGGPMVIVRRAAFESIGGYREVRGAAHEDWELLLRLALAGFRTDVIPEYLHLYRVGEPASLSQISDRGTAMARLIETYEAHLRTIGLGGTAELLSGTYAALTEFRGASHDWARDAMKNACDLGEVPGFLAPLRDWYRKTISLERRQSMHRTLIHPLSKWRGRRGI